MSSSQNGVMEKAQVESKHVAQLPKGRGSFQLLQVALATIQTGSFTWFGAP